jgi:hypothetical protein
MQNESVQQVLSYALPIMRCTKSLILGMVTSRGIEFLLQGDPVGGVVLVAGPIAYEMYLDWVDYGKPSNYLNIIPFPLGTLITFSLRNLRS